MPFFALDCLWHSGFAPWMCPPRARQLGSQLHHLRAASLCGSGPTPTMPPAPLLKLLCEDKSPASFWSRWAPCLGENFEFDRSQFKIQPDGTFRITIRAMAAMAGVDDGGLARSLKTAADENALPCARSLLAQGFNPADVNRWSETGGIPGDAAPFILEHYGINAVSPSAQARHFLLAFTRVGINAYLKEKLGFAQRPQAGQLGEGDLIALAGRTQDPSAASGTRVLSGCCRGQYGAGAPCREPVRRLVGWLGTCPLAASFSRGQFWLLPCVKKIPLQLLELFLSTFQLLACA